MQAKVPTIAPTSLGFRWNENIDSANMQANATRTTPTLPALDARESPDNFDANTKIRKIET